jgi:hypothetical protein
MPKNKNLEEYSKKIGNELLTIITRSTIFEKGALSNLKEQIDSIGRSSDGSFELNIPRNKPLKILKVDHEIISEIEISCIIKGKITELGDLNFSQYSMEITFWSDNPDFCYRKQLDAESIGMRIRDGESVKRIILRYHFDMKKEPTEIKEPLFHFHLGGEMVDDCCLMWHPSNLCEPRIPYPPMDPFLIIDLTLRNFCVRSMYDIYENPRWKENIQICYNLFQKKFDQLQLHQSLFA